MPSSISGAISGWAKDVLNAILGGAGSSGMSGDGVLRKIAHASEFAVLGIELTLLPRHKLKGRLPMLALYGLGIAFIDETIQLFVDGRAGLIIDVWIDFGGFTVGVLLTSLIRLLIARKKNRIRNENCDTPE